MINLLCALIVGAIVLSGAVDGYYLPRKNPNVFSHGDAVRVDINALTPTHTLLHMDFPTSIARRTHDLGGAPAAANVQPSVFRIEMGINATCRVLHPTLQLTTADRAALRDGIDGYRGHIFVDGLEAELSESQELPLRAGYPLGERATQTVFNHLAITIGYERSTHAANGANASRIVWVSVRPISVNLPHETACTDTPQFDPNNFFEQTVDDSSLLYTYSVAWTEAPSALTPWDMYIAASPANDRVHLFVVNSFFILMLWGVMIALLLRRMLDARDAPDDEDGAWTLLHADVFRCPSNPTILFVGVATGAQLICVVVYGLGLGYVGLLSLTAPANLFLRCCSDCVVYASAAVAGFVAACLLKMVYRQAWWSVQVSAAFPMLLFLLVTTLYPPDDAARQVVALVGMWALALAACQLGAMLGFRGPRIAVPCPPSCLPRPIPTRHWSSRALLYYMYVCAVIVDFFCVYGTLSLGQSTVVCRCAVAFALLCVASAEVSIFTTYSHLQHGNHRWWGPAFYVPGGCALLAVCGAMHYAPLVPQSMAGMAVLIAVGLVVAAAVGLIAGCVGFFASFWFTRRLYSALAPEDRDAFCCAVDVDEDVAEEEEEEEEGEVRTWPLCVLLALASSAVFILQWVVRP